MKFNHTRYKIPACVGRQNTRYKLHGVAALITVLSLGGLIMTISMGMALISFWANQNIKSIRDSNKAFYAAQSGIQDTLIKLERNKDFPSGSFNLSLYNTNDVSVSLTNSSGQATVNATSTVGIVNKKLQAVINVDTTTGLVTPSSTVEQTL
jgi:hypothetical protein